MSVFLSSSAVSCKTVISTIEKHSMRPPYMGKHLRQAVLPTGTSYSQSTQLWRVWRVQNVFATWYIIFFFLKELIIYHMESTNLGPIKLACSGKIGFFWHILPVQIWQHLVTRRNRPHTLFSHFFKLVRSWRVYVRCCCCHTVFSLSFFFAGKKGKKSQKIAKSELPGVFFFFVCGGADFFTALFCRETICQITMTRYIFFAFQKQLYWLEKKMEKSGKNYQFKFAAVFLCFFPWNHECFATPVPNSVARF